MNLENEFALQLKAAGYYFERQYKAIPARKYLFDFYIPPDILIEVQGGIYQYKPSHTSASGIRRDAEKLDLAVSNGYKVLLFTSDMVKSGLALEITEKAIGGKNE